MEVTKEQKKQAQELASKHKVKSIFINESGEFFTEQNLAALSVGGDKEKFAEINCAVSVKEEITLSQEELLAQIEAATVKAAVGKMLAAEKKGENRQVIIDACTAKLAALK